MCKYERWVAHDFSSRIYKSALKFDIFLVLKSRRILVVDL